MPDNIPETNNNPLNPRPLVILIDPTTKREVTGVTLTANGWDVVIIDSNEAKSLGDGINALSPNSVSKLPLPSAIIVEAYHPARPTEDTPFIYPLPAEALISSLIYRGLSPLTRDGKTYIPYLLYTRDKRFLSYARYNLNNDNCFFSAVVERTGDGSELLPALSDVTGIIFCDGCKSPLYPTDKALLLLPHFYCARCADNLPVEEKRGREKLFLLRLLRKAEGNFSSNHSRVLPLELSCPLPWE
jgi:hypothetical protein